ncbi:UrcA family protein [Sphingomonas sp. R647]|uniref:UrcA family protein n=1 Tax=Sphingomonas sp. R647 TaxID=2875233 RepID=UPI001CD2278F|nr:UrcA family protein [Sphingomonas sp. R647]MCA1197401.1 UrcA family protein [Sphingomonas sp. R647]
MFANLARAVTLGAVLLVSLPAAARTGKSIEVSYADLNLSAVAGQKAFQRRISRAAMAVCGTADMRDLVATGYRNRCVATALESARPAIELAVRNAATRQLAARDQSVRVAP